MIKRVIRRLARIAGLYPQPPEIKAVISTSLPDYRLKGKRIIVTGGTRGIGLAMARKFVAEGAEVLITGRDAAKAEKIAEDAGCRFMALDLMNSGGFADFIDKASQLLGGIDCLVNNAGVSLHESTFFDVTEETFETQFKTNLAGPFFLTQSFVKYLKFRHEKGDILFLSSETGFTADIRPYGLTKAALNSFVQGLAALLVKDNIRYNAICPGVVATDMTGHSADGDLSYQYNSIKRLYLPEEIAEVATFLLSDSSACISGQMMACNNARTVTTLW